MAKSPKKAYGAPVKDFFIEMLTRDITLEDCILDLLDNCLDGAGRQLMGQKEDPATGKKYSGYSGYRADLVLKPEVFSITDNCGGLSVENAVNYAFHFGRPPDAPQDADFSIGLYGIGLKRAFFKIGKVLQMHSSTSSDAFETTIEVEKWAKIESWDFDLYETAPEKSPGTTIKIIDLNDGVGEEFGDQKFINRLVKIISRDYSFFLQDGFEISVNSAPINPYEFKLKESQEFEPFKITLKTPKKEGESEKQPVIITISAGMADPPPDDESADAPKTDYYGWFVSCNNRIVLAGDKTDKTVWGNEDFQRWHPQYNGFMGIVDFSSSDPKRLPWDTTKRVIVQRERLTSEG
ncbi:MAG: ATP-binding protein [Desulfomonilaceae bacterium]